MSLFGAKKKPVEEDKIPTCVDDVIPIRESYEDGICLVGRNLWSKTCVFISGKGDLLTLTQDLLRHNRNIGK